MDPFEDVLCDITECLDKVIQPCTIDPCPSVPVYRVSLATVLFMNVYFGLLILHNVDMNIDMNLQHKQIFPYRHGCPRTLT